jgi:secreted PhoX family phosphatase
MGSIVSTQAQVPLSFGSTWKYLDNGSDQGTAWIDPAYNDAAWLSGPAPLGYAMSGVVTPVSFGPSSSNKYRTTYYRRMINVTSANLAACDSILVTLRIDDGAVLHINGTEIMRNNMPAGAISYTTLANSPAVGSAPAVFSKMLDKNLFTVGDNTFAVEIHQQAATSSDTYFDLSIEPIKNDSVLVNEGSVWKYNNQGVAAPANWTSVAFDDASWSAGNGVLGYGNGDENTVVSYGTNAGNKHITTYFRNKFSVANTNGYANLQLQLKRDDGAIVYLNGVDVYRNNMAASAVNYNTTAISPVEGADENAWLTINIPDSVLVNGDNVIAVEVHKYNATETDLRFDMKASLQQAAKTQTPATSVITCDPLLSQAIGCFTSVKPSAQTPGFSIPSTHTFQLIAKQGAADFYTNSIRSMPSTHDFTAYLATAGSSKQGVVAINHENDPGDVSLVSVHLNEASQTWAVDSARLVDFSPLVRTTRNCSGGITPWGTVVTSEETYSTGDVNGDGYQDRGWQVEIDPVSGKIVDYDGDGQPDKIWAMGRMSHENVAVSADSAIAYQTEDGGTGGVYKYVMDVKGKLNNGTLYVLKRDNSTGTAGTWIQVPNTTQAQRNTVSTVITSLGGTNWSGPEDIEFGPDGKMYFTSKGTGTIWRFNDNGSTVNNIEAWVTNTSYPITHSEGTTNESFGTGIDNLAFDGEGNLWAQQDGGRGHLWVIRPDHTPTTPKVDLFAITPSGSESTGLTFTPDFKYGFLSIQHPSSGNATLITDAAGNTVRFNAAATIVIARKEFLGTNAVKPTFKIAGDTAACGSSILKANTNADILNVWGDNSTDTALTVTASGWYKATAYANNGQSYTDSVYVTINPVPSVELGANQTVYIGYAPLSCTTITANVTSGTPDFNYAWSNGATTASITVCPTTKTQYAVSVTDINGCTATDSVDVCVKDVGCGTTKNPKVVVCHRGNNICVADNAVNAHLAHGDYLGTCGSNNCESDFSRSAYNNLIATEFDNGSSIKLYPNPTNATASVNLELVNVEETSVQVTIKNVFGQEVFNQQIVIDGDHVVKQLNFGHNLITGTYWVTIISGTTIITEKLIVQ